MAGESVGLGLGSRLEITKQERLRFWVFACQCTGAEGNPLSVEQNIEVDIKSL